MSTRAIIAIPTKKGYKTAWCWCDGHPSDLGKTLNHKFTTPELANELVNHHSFSSLMSKEDYDDFLEWRKRENIQGDERERFISLSNGYFLYMYPHQGKTVAGIGQYGFFKSIAEMLEQDLNFVYVFENGKWKTYK